MEVGKNEPRRIQADSSKCHASRAPHDHEQPLGLWREDFEGSSGGVNEPNVQLAAAAG